MIAAILEQAIPDEYFAAKCRTKEIDGKVVITQWDADAAGRPIPTKAEIAQWTATYKKPKEADRAEGDIKSNEALKGIVRFLAKRFNLTEAEVLNEIKGELTGLKA